MLFPFYWLLGCWLSESLDYHMELWRGTWEEGKLKLHKAYCSHCVLAMFLGKKINSSDCCKPVVNF